MIQDKVKGASIKEAVTEERRAEWIEYLDKQGTATDFNINNVQDTPTFWDRVKSWFLGSDNE